MCTEKKTFFKNYLTKYIYIHIYKHMHVKAIFHSLKPFAPVSFYLPPVGSFAHLWFRHSNTGLTSLTRCNGELHYERKSSSIWGKMQMSTTVKDWRLTVAVQANHPSLSPSPVWRSQVKDGRWAVIRFPVGMMVEALFFSSGGCKLLSAVLHFFLFSSHASGYWNSFPLSHQPLFLKPSFIDKQNSNRESYLLPTKHPC